MRLCHYNSNMKRTKDPSLLTQELRDAFERMGMNTVEISLAIGKNQSQVYRNLHNEPKTVNKTVKELCHYAKIDYMERAPDPSQSPTLMRAIAELWDGSEPHARRIAAAIFALKRARM